MPEDTEDLVVRFIRNDGGDTFMMKAENVERSHNNSFIAKSILQAAGDVAGRDIDLGFETYNVQGVIQGTDPGTYPSGGEYPSIDTGSWNEATEKEMCLNYAMNHWGPTTGGGFDRLQWGPRMIPGMMTKYSATEDATGDRGPGKFSFTVEWTYANIIL